jgi:hypothetical protein
MQSRLPARVEPGDGDHVQFRHDFDDFGQQHEQLEHLEQHDVDDNVRRERCSVRR